MKYHFSANFRSSSLFQNNRNKLKRMEWFIAIFFIVSLLIGSGVFIKASNAASVKSRSHSHLSHSEVATIPGSMRLMGVNKKEQASTESSVIYVESDDSCELKKVDS